MNPAARDPSVKETEVLAKARRRRFTAEYKERILKEVSEARASGRTGEVGAILRQEGLYSSHLTVWQRQLEKGGRAGLSPKRRGPKPKPVDPRDKENERLREGGIGGKKIEAWMEDAETMAQSIPDSIFDEDHAIPRHLRLAVKMALAIAILRSAETGRVIHLATDDIERIEAIANERGLSIKTADGMLLADYLQDAALKFAWGVNRSGISGGFRS